MKSFKQFDESYTDRYAHRSAEDDNKGLFIAHSNYWCNLILRFSTDKFTTSHDSSWLLVEETRYIFHREPFLALSLSQELLESP